MSSVNKDTTICISDKDTVESGSHVVRNVQDCDVPVVDVEFLDDAAKGEALSKILPHTISPWGAPRHALSTTEETDYAARAFEKGEEVMKECESADSLSMESIVQMLER